MWSSTTVPRSSTMHVHGCPHITVHVHGCPYRIAFLLQCMSMSACPWAPYVHGRPMGAIIYGCPFYSACPWVPPLGSRARRIPRSRGIVARTVTRGNQAVGHRSGYRDAVLVAFVSSGLPETISLVPFHAQLATNIGVLRVCPAPRRKSSYQEHLRLERSQEFTLCRIVQRPDANH